MSTDISNTSKTFSYEKIHTIICNTAVDASEAIANEIANIIRNKNNEGQPAVLGLATGATPKSIYRALIQKHRNEGLNRRARWFRFSTFRNRT